MIPLDEAYFLESNKYGLQIAACVTPMAPNTMVQSTPHYSNVRQLLRIPMQSAPMTYWNQQMKHDIMKFGLRVCRVFDDEEFGGRSLFNNFE